MGAGIKFERVAPAGTLPERTRKIKPKDKVHCLPVYLVEAGGPHVPPGKAGITMVTVPGGTRKTFKNEVEDQLPPGTSDAFKKRVGYGTCIFMLKTAGGRTLAHEMGHAMGLAPNLETDEGFHMDPVTGAAIPAGAGRLMEGAGGPANTTITEPEKKIAVILAKFLLGQFQPCERTGMRIPVPGSKIFQRAVLINQGASVLVRVFMRRPLTRVPPFLLRFETAQRKRQSPVRFIEHGWSGARFTTKFSPLKLKASPVEPDFRADSRKRKSNTHMEFRIPRVFIPTFRGRAAFRMYAHRTDSERPVSSSLLRRLRFRGMDLVMPALILDVKPRSRKLQARAGGRVRISGRVSRSRTYTGRTDLYLQLDGRGGSRTISMGVLKKRKGPWSRTVRLPEDLKPGSYRAFLLGKCVTCKTSTTLNLTLRVLGSEKPRPRPPEKPKPVYRPPLPNY